MSRIGRLPIEFPASVSINISPDNTVSVKGPKGELSGTYHKDMQISVDGNVLTVTRPSDKKEHRALHGLTRALIANMITGVTEGFAKTLEIVGVGYRAQLQGKKLVLSLGYSHPIEVEQPEGITFEVPQPTTIVVRGIDKHKVGQVAANIREFRSPEPYKGKGIRYAGEYVRRKEGKTGM